MTGSTARDLADFPTFDATNETTAVTTPARAAVLPIFGHPENRTIKIFLHRPNHAGRLVARDEGTPKSVSSWKEVPDANQTPAPFPPRGRGHPDSLRTIRDTCRASRCRQLDDDWRHAPGARLAHGDAAAQRPGAGRGRLHEHMRYDCHGGALPSAYRQLGEHRLHARSPLAVHGDAATRRPGAGHGRLPHTYLHGCPCLRATLQSAHRHVARDRPHAYPARPRYSYTP